MSTQAIVTASPLAAPPVSSPRSTFTGQAVLVAWPPGVCDGAPLGTGVPATRSAAPSAAAVGPAVASSGPSELTAALVAENAISWSTREITRAVAELPAA